MPIGPINYQMQVAQPFQAAAQGYQFGAAIRDDRYKQQQQEIAAQQQRQMQADLGALASNRNASGADYASVMTKYPQLAESLQKSWSTLNTDQQQGVLAERSRVFAALASGADDVAERLLQEGAQAKRDAGMEKEAAADEMMAKMVRLNPDTARTSAGIWLAGIPGGDKVLEGAAKLGGERRADQLQPGLVSKGAADASKASTEAVIAAATAPATVAEANLKPAVTQTGMRKTDADIEKIAADIDIAKDDQRIKDLNTQIAQANSETTRGQLQVERDKLQLSRDEKIQAKQETAQSQMETFTRGIETAQKALNHPGMDGFFYGAGTIGQRMAALIPGTESKDFRALIETMQSQQFTAGISAMVGLGALSDAEGKKIGASVANLDPDQSPKALKNAIGVALSMMQKGRDKLVASGKLPKDGGAFVMRHPTYGNVDEGAINRLLSQFPGTTREQVLQYLQSTGGK